MKAIAKLKDEARKHEQKEEWEKAIQAYLEVIQIGEQGDGAELELPLYNRVGDLYVRLGRQADAVTYYEQAADRYAEAGLYNNAIALCNKALRYDANRLPVFKKLGSFSALQGFFTDARRWYLEYAQRAAKGGSFQEAIGALQEYVAANDDVDVRELLARMLRDAGRKDEAVAEFKHAYALRVAAGQQGEADAIRAEVQGIDPDADVTEDGVGGTETAAGAHAESLPGFSEEAPAPVESDDDTLMIEPTALDGGLDHVDAADFGSIDLDAGLGGGLTSSVDEIAPLDIGLEQPETGMPESVVEEAVDESVEETFDDEGFDDSEDDGAFELPTLDVDFDSDDEEPAEELPMLDSVDLEARMSDFGDDLGSLDMGVDFERDETGLAGAPLPSLDDEQHVDELHVGDLGGELPTFDEPVAEPEPEPEPEPVKEPEPQPVAAAPPPAVEPPPPPKQEKKKEYVDLAALLADDDEAEDTTRFVVEEMAPTGDEEKDFADMLQQFKQKVAETIPKEDAGSHYDLGIAFKEMGLIDEAIAEFQTALRAGNEKLKVYEELGSCFVQKGQYSVAITILNRAQTMPFNDEQELLGVYYNLGRANEELGNRAEAKTAYEKIIAIDIGFMDTTERLSKL